MVRSIKRSIAQGEDIAGQRVADASVMPSVVTENTHSLTIVIVQKAVAMIGEVA